VQDYTNSLLVDSLSCSISMQFLSQIQHATVKKFFCWIFETYSDLEKLLLLGPKKIIRINNRKKKFENDFTKNVSKFNIYFKKLYIHWDPKLYNQPNIYNLCPEQIKCTTVCKSTPPYKKPSNRKVYKSLKNCAPFPFKNKLA